MTTVRSEAVAGTFYPRDSEELRAVLDRDLDRARALGVTDLAGAEAVIAPHAGYRYSGPVAARVYAGLDDRAGAIERVVIMGPAHRAPIDGVAVPSVDALATPLGALRVDAVLRDRVIAHPAVEVDDAAHADEHSIEVHLPFVRRVLGEVSILPLVVGRATPEIVAEVLDLVWGGPETLVVVSSDLSHYETDEVASAHDRRTAAAILAAKPNDIGPRDACGFVPIGGLLVAARRRGLAVRLVDLKTSADSAGTPERVVGYGAFVLSAAPIGLDHREQEALLAAAETAVRTRLEGRGRWRPQIDDMPPRLTQPCATFVTLERDGRLLGCIGTLEATRPLVEDVAHNALGAGFSDPRMAAISVDDYEAMDVKISVLGPLVPFDASGHAELAAALRPGLDGLLVEGDGRRATFLPSVWAQVTGADDFVARLWAKAGLPRGSWPSDMQLHRYRTTEFGRSGPRSAIG